MTLFIKNMVCVRCIRTVSRLLDESGIMFQSLKLGEAQLIASPNPIQLAALSPCHEMEGFELLDDRNRLLVMSHSLMT